MDFHKVSVILLKIQRNPTNFVQINDLRGQASGTDVLNWSLLATGKLAKKQRKPEAAGAGILMH